MIFKDIKEYKKMSAEDRIVVLKQWIRDEIILERENLLRLAGIDPEQNEEMQELLQYSLEDLPLEINNWAEDSPQYTIIKYRLKHGIQPEDCQDGEVLEWEDFIKAALQFIHDMPYYDEKNAPMKDSLSKIYNLCEIATVTGDEKLYKYVSQWYILI